MLENLVFTDQQLEQKEKAIIFAFHFIQKENQIMRKAKFKKQLTIAIPPEHFEQIQKITDDQEISLAEWIRDAVAAALTKNQPKEETM
jgi:predicted HicB family RNase H-like nuclease